LRVLLFITRGQCLARVLILSGVMALRCVVTCRCIVVVLRGGSARRSDDLRSSDERAKIVFRDLLNLLNTINCL
jgi:hypothetical protein